MNGLRQTEVGQVLAYDLDPAVRPGKYQIQPENGESGWMGRNTERGGGGYLQKLLLKRRPARRYFDKKERAGRKAVTMV